jgi:hypothetical protein
MRGIIVLQYSPRVRGWGWELGLRLGLAYPLKSGIINPANTAYSRLGLGVGVGELQRLLEPWYIGEGSVKAPFI